MDTRLFYKAEAKGIEPIEELSVVSLTKSVEVAPVGYLPAGAEGAVVSVYDDGDRYEVEFTHPFSALVTLKSEDIIAVSGAERDDVIAAAKQLSNRRG